jgi:hypothetical protein
VTRTREWLRWQGPTPVVNNRPILSSERAPHMNKPATAWRNKNSSLGAPSDVCVIPHTGRLTLGCIITLTLIWLPENSEGGCVA